MQAHVAKTVSNGFAVLRWIRSINQSVTKHQVNSPVARRFYGFDASGSTTLTSLPNVLLDQLQSVLHAYVRLIYSARKYTHVTPLLRDLHWLQVPERIVWQCLRFAASKLPVCRAHSCGQRRFSMATSIIKHGGACHSAIKALDDWW